MKFTAGDGLTGVIEIHSLEGNARVFGKFFYQIGDIVVGDPEDEGVDLYHCLCAMKYVAHDSGSRDAEEIAERDPRQLFRTLFEHAYGDAGSPGAWHRLNVTIECPPLESLFCFCCDFREGSTFLCARHTADGNAPESVESVEIPRGAFDALIMKMQSYLLGVFDMFSKIRDEGR